MSTSGVPCKMQVLSLSTICISSRKRYQLISCWDSPTQFLMSWLTIGLVTWLQWNGGTICGLMKALLTSSVTSALKRLRTNAKPLTTNQACRCFWTEKAGDIMKIKWSQPIQSEVLFLIPVLPTLFLTVSHTQKELPQWSNSCSWCLNRTFQRLYQTISKNTNGLMPLWLILSLKWKSTIM